MVKIIAVGDPHGNLEKIKKIPFNGVDLILVTGDLGNSSIARKFFMKNVKRKEKGKSEILIDEKLLIKEIKERVRSSVAVIRHMARFAPVFIVYGNIDYNNEDTYEFMKKHNVKIPFLTKELKKIKGVRVINNKVARFRKLRIGGLEYFSDVSWVKEFRPENYKENLLKAKLSSIEAELRLELFGKVDILLSHQSPYSVLDEVRARFAPVSWQGKHAGSRTILNYIKKYKPKFVFCGHIHEAMGQEKVGKTTVVNVGSEGGYGIVEI